MNTLKFVVCLFLVMAVMGGVSYAQVTVGYTFNGDSVNDFSGYSVSNAGDVNGDGFADLIVGASGDDNNGIDSGSARVFSGFDGSVLYTFDGDSANDYFGYSVSSAGDVNGDGFADFIVGAYGDANNGTESGGARVFSGFDGSTLYTFDGDSAFDRFGFSVSDAGDVNGDGFADLIVGAYGDDNNGAVSGSARVFSGFDGSILYTFDGDGVGDFFGRSVSNAGDVNRDGFADLIVGAVGDDNNGTNSGIARVFSGLDGSILYNFEGDSVGDNFGQSVSHAGDVNGDGFADLIVGAYLDDNNGNESGSVRVFSGLDGSILYNFDGDSAEDYFGVSVSHAGDVNGDGFADLIVGAHGDNNNGNESGSARVFSGLDGSILHTFDGSSGFDFFGFSVSSAGDVNGDGFADLIVGAYGDDSNGLDSGSARVLLAPTLPVLKYRTETTFSHGLDLNWFPDAADPSAVTGTLVCDGGTPGGFGVKLRSFARIDFLAFGNLPLLIAIDSINFLDSQNLSFDGMGEFTISGASRKNPVLAGFDVYLQIFEISPVISSSPGLRFAVAP